MTAAPQTKGERRIVTLGNRSPEKAEEILTYVVEGKSPTVAAAMSGIAPSTLTAWKQEDPAFAELIEVAELQSHGGDEAAIIKARDRGDWRAALERLRAGKITSKHWGPSQTGGGLTINFNLRGSDQLNAPTIDVTPEKAE